MSNYIFKNKASGITLIALIITVIIMVILAGVTVNVAINGGLFESAGNAKESTEIVSEKEAVQKAVIFAENASKTGIITIAEMQKAINKFEEGKTATAMQNGENIVVKFNESNRYYEIDNKGNVEGPKEPVKDEMAGDITKGGKYDGTSIEKAFQINCIEDLVAFSIMTNGGNSTLGLASNSFSNKYVILTESIDFNSIFSYNDYTTTKYGDLNTDGTIEDIRTELTKTDDGCIGFKGILNFAGTFDGKRNTIKNIYQKNTIASKRTGLFVIDSGGCIIKNLNLTGTIINTKWEAAGILASNLYGKVQISNCKNYANVTGFNVVGGISCWQPSGMIEDCYNYGNITITGYSYQYGGAGGITGYAGTNATIQDCINEGNISGNYTRAGIVGCVEGSNIVNCINRGKSVGGIAGHVRYGSNNIVNCCNNGECNSGIVATFQGANWPNVLELNIKNCYNLGKVTNSGIVGTQGTICQSITLNIENSYNAGESSKAILGGRGTDSRTTTVTNITNTYYDQSKSISMGVQIEGITALDEEDMKNNATFVQTLNNNIGTNLDWKRWKLGENGYPVFE